MSNVIICPQCEALLIIEEYKTHECGSNYKFEGKYLLMRHNGKWRSLFLPLIFSIPPQFQQPDKTPDDSTEPKKHEKGKLNENFLHVSKAKIAILM